MRLLKSDYSPMQLLRTEPAGISTILMAWVNFLVITHTVHWSVEAVAALNTALIVTLTGLYVKRNTTTKDSFEKRLKEQLDLQEAKIIAFLATPPESDPKAAAKVGKATKTGAAARKAASAAA